MSGLTPYSNAFYEAYHRDVCSQNGEDGVVEEIRRRLNIEDGWVCEFGAWDGRHLSNTFLLVRDRRFKAVYIEGDVTKYAALLNTVKQHPTITPICAMVLPEHQDDGNTTLDTLLKRTAIPIEFFLLSIDIDSSDYQVWKSVEQYKPLVVVVEINSSVHPHETLHIHDGARYNGTSFRPMLQLGREKGYTLLCHTGNMVFVRNDFYAKLNVPRLAFDDDHVSLFRRAWL